MLNSLDSGSKMFFCLSNIRGVAILATNFINNIIIINSVIFLQSSTKIVQLIKIGQYNKNLQAKINY